MKVSTQVLISAIIAAMANLIIVGLHINQNVTEWILTYVCIIGTIWFFVVVFTALFRKIKAN